MYCITFLLDVCLCVCFIYYMYNWTPAKIAFSILYLSSPLRRSLSLLLSLPDCCEFDVEYVVRSIWRMFNVCLWVQRLFLQQCCIHTHRQTLHTCNKVILFLWPILSFIRTFARMHTHNQTANQPTQPSFNFISLDRMNILRIDMCTKSGQHRSNQRSRMMIFEVMLVVLAIETSAGGGGVKFLDCFNTHYMTMTNIDAIDNENKNND